MCVLAYIEKAFPNEETNTSDQNMKASKGVNEGTQALVWGEQPARACSLHPQGSLHLWETDELEGLRS